ncbi:MAG: LysM peptidoglycan-binding domain-containing protein, partial [Thermoflexia bacterium]
ATPTPSPTPVIYIVQEGDTLAGIAARYGVSVEALQRVNNIANPLFLQIGQRLVIPVGQQEALAPSELLPTPTPMPIGIRGVAFYETPVGSLHCLGEVVNTTAYTLTNVQVRVTLFDAEGTPVAEGRAFVAADLIPPTGRAPFSLLFTVPPPNFVSQQVALLRAEAAGELAERDVPIAVEEVTSTPYGPQIEISGFVRNMDPSRVAVVVIVVATTYDEGGLVNGFRQQRVEVGEGLAPGARAPFQMRLTVYGGSPKDVSLFAFGRAR